MNQETDRPWLDGARASFDLARLDRFGKRACESLHVSLEMIARPHCLHTLDARFDGNASGLQHGTPGQIVLADLSPRKIVLVFGRLAGLDVSDRPLQESEEAASRDIRARVGVVIARHVHAAV